MLTTYLVCLLIGGTFVASSVFLGGHEDGDVDHDCDVDHDLDVDLDVDHDFDVDHDLDVDHDIDVDHDLDAGMDGDGALVAVVGGPRGVAKRPRALPLWRPFMSMRFWTFFLAFFGLTGAALTGLQLGSQILIASTALVMGLGSGYGVAFAIQSLRSQVVDSSLKRQDYIGATGRVLLPLAPGQMGKVRLELKGRIVDFPAETEDDQPIESKQTVLVYGVKDGVLQVTDPGRRQLSP